MSKLTAMEAMLKFENLMDQLKASGPTEFGGFLNLIQRHYLTAMCSGEQVAMAHHSMRLIAEDLKKIVPGNGVMPSENLLKSKEGENELSYHVDAFIYDDCDVDELVTQKNLPRNICMKCSSTDVKPVEYISYSSSRERAAFIFQSLITQYLKNKTVLDIGSRIGGILYGAYHFSAADKIIGIEMNEELCEVQRKIVAKHNLGDRIEVVQGNILDHGDIIEGSDVVIMNNVFEHFLNDEDQIKIWQFLREKINKSGTLVVTSPKLEESFDKLKINIDVSNWVEEILLTDPLSAMFMEDHSELGTLHLYKVK